MINGYESGGSPCIARYKSHDGYSALGGETLAQDSPAMQHLRGKAKGGNCTQHFPKERGEGKRGKGNPMPRPYTI